MEIKNMTINIAIELLQKSKFDTDAEATDYADYLAGQVDLKESDCQA